MLMVASSPSISKTAALIPEKSRVRYINARAMHANALVFIVSPSFL